MPAFAGPSEIEDPEPVSLLSEQRSRAFFGGFLLVETSTGTMGRLRNLLAVHFVRKFAERQHKAISIIPESVLESPQAARFAAQHAELQNVIEGA